MKHPVRSSPPPITSRPRLSQQLSQVRLLLSRVQPLRSLPQPSLSRLPQPQPLQQSQLPQRLLPQSLRLLSRPHQHSPVLLRATLPRRPLRRSLLLSQVAKRHARTPCRVRWQSLARSRAHVHHVWQTTRSPLVEETARHPVRVAADLAPVAAHAHRVVDLAPVAVLAHRVDSVMARSVRVGDVVHHQR